MFIAYCLTKSLFVEAMIDALLAIFVGIVLAAVFGEPLFAILVLVAPVIFILILFIEYRGSGNNDRQR